MVQQVMQEAVGELAVEEEVVLGEHVVLVLVQIILALADMGEQVAQEEVVVQEEEVVVEHLECIFLEVQGLLQIVVLVLVQQDQGVWVLQVDPEQVAVVAVEVLAQVVVAIALREVMVVVEEEEVTVEPVSKALMELVKQLYQSTVQVLVVVLPQFHQMVLHQQIGIEDVVIRK
jgi:hypothetical protein